MKKTITHFPLAALLLFMACAGHGTAEPAPSLPPFGPVYGLIYRSFEFIPLGDGFDFPVGPPHARGYYNAQPFGENFHLGDDWNGLGGGNSDLGDPVFAIANGRVAAAAHEGPGWGNVVRILHRTDSITVIESLYAHLDTLLVQRGDSLRRGMQIGTIGTADGVYLAHLHLEIRTRPGLPLGGGYATQTEGFVDPTAFIRANRPK